MHVSRYFVLESDPFMNRSIESDLVDLLGVHFVFVAPNDIHNSHLGLLVEETTLAVFECDLLLNDRFFTPFAFFSSDPECILYEYSLALRPINPAITFPPASSLKMPGTFFVLSGWNSRWMVGWVV